MQHINKTTFACLILLLYITEYRQIELVIEAGRPSVYIKSSNLILFVCMSDHNRFASNFYWETL